jgi:hypothetical protein
MYEKAAIDATYKERAFEIKTENVRKFALLCPLGVNVGQCAFSIDGQKVQPGEASLRAGNAIFEKVDGKWMDWRDPALQVRREKELRKSSYLQGPIDDAFSFKFRVVKTSESGWFAATDKHTDAAATQFAALWDRYFRGALPVRTSAEYEAASNEMCNLVLFGDPQSNPLIAKALPKLPIIWTKEKLVVNGVEYDPKTHVPVLIYPNPLQKGRYIVINSGHTFKEADLKGTNALLYPRLGDWAVIKPTPTEKDPAAYEVVAAGLFDENWKFKK